jgi:hypothetical protein
VDLSNEAAIGTRTPTRFALGIQRRPFELLVSVRRHLESLESLVIRWRQPDSQDTSDVDEREPQSI